MNTIFNLVLFLTIITILVNLCNGYTKVEETKVNNTKIKNREDFDYTENQIKNIKSNDLFFFNYEDVKEDIKPLDLDKKFHDELESGVHFMPKYYPPKEYEELPFYKNKNEDQKIIHDNKLYEKPIHRFRTLELNDNDAPKKINEIFNDSILDFKSLVPLKKGMKGDLIIEGSSELQAYAPDFISYENENPENGGMLPNLYNGVFGFDPLIQSDTAVF
jgi:hypothetical protein